MTMRSWTLVMVPLFSVSDPLLEKPEDLKNGVGDFFTQKVMQIPNIETVFESELI